MSNYAMGRMITRQMSTLWQVIWLAVIAAGFVGGGVAGYSLGGPLAAIGGSLALGAAVAIGSSLGIIYVHMQYLTPEVADG